MRSLCRDSIMKDVFTALSCFMLEFWDLQQYTPGDNATAIHLLEKLPGWGFPACIHLPEKTRICKVGACCCHVGQGPVEVPTGALQ